MPSDLEFDLERHPTAIAELERRDGIVTEHRHTAPGTPSQALLTVADVLALASSHADAVSAIEEARKVLAAREADATTIEGRLDAIEMVIGSERLQAILTQAATPHTGEAMPEPPHSHEGADTARNATQEEPSLSGAQGEETREGVSPGRRAGFGFGKPRS